ncbi:MAG: protein kinase, partial [Candidatus Eremiobacteraeota bacterium]|nr:protein kinase [Candidatus Eremiobacteraeota bacterium]
MAGLGPLDQTLDPPPEDDEGGLGKPEHTLDLPPESEDEARNASLEVPDHTLDLDPGDAKAGVEASKEQVSLPGYDLVKRLGSGATGNVWEAVQSSTGQRVAIKVLGRITRSQDQLFKKEMEQLIALSGHNNIVGLLDANLEHVPPFLVMPLFHQSLEFYTVGRSNLGLLTNERVSRWFKELAGALRYVHQRGILHCDVKPPNVLLDRDQAKLVDFGQAALVKHGEARLGTFFYMSPEQARAGIDRSMQADATWDVYSLGATVYHLLAGEPPRHSESIDDTLSRASNVTEQLDTYAEMLARAPLKPLRTLNSECDHDLAMIVEKCLRVDPKERFQDMGALLDDLERREKNFPLSCRPHTFGYVVGKWARRNPLVLASLVLCLCLVGGAVFKMVAAYKETEIRRGEAEKARGVAEKLARDSLLQEAVARLKQQQSSGAVMLARLALDGPDVLTHHTQLADSVRHLPFPLYNQRAVDACWYKGKLFYLDRGKIWQRDEKGETRQLGPVSLTEAGRFEVAPSGETVLIWGKDGWEVRAVTGWKLLLSGRAEPETVAFTDGCLAVSRDNLISLWRIGKDSEPETLIHHDRVRSLKFSPRGDLLASASDDRTCRLWSVERPEKRTLLWSTSGVVSAFFDSDGKRLVSCSRGGVATQWDVQSGRKVGAEMVHDAPVLDGCYSPDGWEILTLSSNGRVRSWDRQGVLQRDVGQSGGKATALGYSPDGSTIFTTVGNLVWLWNSSTGAERYRPVELEREILRPTFNEKGRLLAGTEVGSWRVWDCSGVPPIPARLMAGRGLSGCAYSPDDSEMAVAVDGKVQLYNRKTGRKVGAPIPVAGVKEVLFTPDGRSLIAYGWRTELWDLSTRTMGVLHPGLNKGTLSEQIAAVEGELAITGYGDARVLAADNKQRTLPIQKTVYATFSANERSVLFSSTEASLLYDLD